MQVIDTLKPGPEGSAGRSVGVWMRNNGSVSGLLEWTTATPAALQSRIADVLERIPAATAGSTRPDNRPEETRTLPIDGFFKEGARTALVYRTAQQPTNLREVLLNTPKPTGDDRRALCAIIAAQVRSLHVHFHLTHGALRTESFVFFPRPRVHFGSTVSTAPPPPDLTRPYILDWARQPASSMYQHPQYDDSTTTSQSWTNEIWALLMVLSEIAEWQPLEQLPLLGEEELRERQKQRREMMVRSDWRGEHTAAVFRFGFAFLDRSKSPSPAAARKISRWTVKAFYDELCEMLGPVAVAAAAAANNWAR